MKLLITLFLMVTIQVTFIQKVIASVSFSEVDVVSVNHCNMDMMDMSSVSCPTEMVDMKNCQTDCDMMTVVSVAHFSEDELAVLFAYSQLIYPSLTTSNTYFQPASLYRPPLFS
jgi:hypothetical protein